MVCFIQGRFYAGGSARPPVLITFLPCTLYRLHCIYHIKQQLTRGTGPVQGCGTGHRQSPPRTTDCKNVRYRVQNGGTLWHLTKQRTVMCVKVSADEMCDLMDSYLPRDVPWATVKQVAEWIGIDHRANANVMGVLFGRVFGTSAAISYKGAKVRAWLVRNHEPLTYREWTNAEIRAQLDSNAATLANRPTGHL